MSPAPMPPATIFNGSNQTFQGSSLTNTSRQFGKPSGAAQSAIDKYGSTRATPSSAAKRLTNAGSPRDPLTPTPVHG